MSTPTPGAGGAYRYDHETDRYVLIQGPIDPFAPAHPFAADLVAPADPAPPADSEDEL